MSNPEHYRKLEHMYARAPTNDYFQPRLHVEEGRSELVIPVRRAFFHAAGAVHGSTYFKVLDDAAFFAVNSLVEDVFVLTVTFSIHLLRPVSEGELRATGRIVSASERLYSAESVLLDVENRVVARGMGTFMPSDIPLDESVGYA